MDVGRNRTAAGFRWPIHCIPCATTASRCARGRVMGMAWQRTGLQQFLQLGFVFKDNDARLNTYSKQGFPRVMLRKGTAKYEKMHERINASGAWCPSCKKEWPKMHLLYLRAYTIIYPYRLGLRACLKYTFIYEHALLCYVQEGDMYKGTTTRLLNP